LNIPSYLIKQTKAIDKALDKFLPKKSEYPKTLHEAMRYSVFSGGKRIRPVFVLEACRAVGGDPRKVMPAACAIEFIHNYSLIHDDLPCMDDDDLRRGQKTCHKKFNEETALLAGDALLTLAFRVLSSVSKSNSAKDLERQLISASWIAEAIGSRGMVGGQAVDLEYQDKEAELPTIEYINMHKTGALIAVCLRVGATLGGGTKSQVEALFRYGKYVGLLFQIVDDIMDREGYAKSIGVPEARKQAEELLSKARKELGVFNQKGLILGQIADFVLTRNY
jgi:geranylgeranyl diphosphate synthase type II